MDKNTIYMIGSGVICLLLLMFPQIPGYIKLIAMALTVFVIIFTKRGIMLFIKANKNYKKNLDSALSDYKKALKIGLPNDYTIACSSTLIQHGFIEEGKEALLKVVNTDTPKLEIKANRKIALSMAYWLEGDVDRAIKYIEEVLATTFRDKNLYINASTYYLEKGDLNSFNKIVKEWKSKKLSTAALLDLEAASEILKGNYKRANSIISDLLSKTNYTFPDPYIHDAQIKMYYNQRKEAISAFEKALENTAFNACTIISKESIKQAIDYLKSDKAPYFISGCVEDPLMLINGKLPKLSNKVHTYNSQEEASFDEIVEERFDDINTALNEDDERWLKEHNLV